MHYVRRYHPHRLSPRLSAYVSERPHLNLAAIDYVNACKENDRPIPSPGTLEAEQMFADFGPTFAERQLAARRAGMARPADALRERVTLVQIGEPAPRRP